MDVFPKDRVTTFVGQATRLRLAVMVCCSLIFSLAHANNQSTRQFIWEQANTQATLAEKPEDFAKAAMIYQRLVTEGVTDPKLFKNLGAVQILAGDFEAASRALQRAERYEGASPETQQGLLAIVQHQTDKPQAELAWTRTFFFWHFKLPAQTRLLIGLYGWAFLWVGVLLMLCNRKWKIDIIRNLAEAIIVIGGGIALSLFSSFGLSLVQN